MLKHGEESFVCVFVCVFVELRFAQERQVTQHESAEMRMASEEVLGKSVHKKQHETLKKWKKTLCF